MAFTGFGSGATQFYDDLDTHNSREWWQANKRRYEDEVRRPMEQLLEELSPAWGEAKLFRPNRDTRFSKDKAPYKTNIAAVIQDDRGGSVYLSLSSDGLHVGGGGYHLDRPQLARFRATVAEERPGCELEGIAADLRAAKADVTSHSTLKTAPRGYAPDHPRIDLLRRDGLVGIWSHPPRKWLQTAAVRARVEDGWRNLRPLNDWLAANVGP